MEPAPFAFSTAILTTGSLAVLLIPLGSSSLGSPDPLLGLPSRPGASTASLGPLNQVGETTRQGRRSLEDLLREVRAERVRTVASLLPEVTRIVAEIDDLKSSRRGPLSRAKANELFALGPGALALLVPYLEPGKEVSRQTVFRSELISDVLRQKPSATTTDALIQIAREGSLQARLGALNALESTGEPHRVAPAIIELAAGERAAGLKREAIEAMSRAAFRTLAALDDDRALAFMGEALKSSDPLLCAGALSALAGAPAESSAAQILTLLETLEDPKPVAASIADYYEKHDQLLEDPEHARALGSIAVHEATPNEPRVRMFDTIRLTDAKIGTGLKRDVAPFLDASRPDVRMAARLLMARLGDRGARKEVLQEFDDRIKQDKNSLTAYQDRATIYHEIGDWNAALRDWRVVMTQIAAEEVPRARKEPFIGISRSLARLKKFRDAASYLSQGPISVEELQKLGFDRDFREMKESRYGDVFQFGDR
ncbi:hypothetical protein Poly30_21950 [Planctomycetes bacterium Poly30]|uniref:HEAT repeat domain-containing protein n=1 Tax=Saltatorellus ferox TaxID=2528018 RepID=A0A518ERG3_9BACT|nr:hypothetical protein Poly30_21950 [Planctomycetes bacterium Poly30]